MLKSITMTATQTATYDAGGNAAETLMRELRDQARAICGDNDRVEIYTADGIVVDTVDKED